MGPGLSYFISVIFHLDYPWQTFPRQRSRVITKQSAVCHVEIVSFKTKMTELPKMELYNFLWFDFDLFIPWVNRHFRLQLFKISNLICKVNRKARHVNSSNCWQPKMNYDFIIIDDCVHCKRSSERNAPLQKSFKIM